MKRFTLDFIPVAACWLHLDAQWSNHLGTHFRKQLTGGIA